MSRFFSSRWVRPLALTAVLYLAAHGTASAIPSFARSYNFSCNVCHAAFPHLNPFGEQFAGELNLRMPNWKQNTVQAGDDRLRLPAQLPLSTRASGSASALRRSACLR